MEFSSFLIIDNTCLNHARHFEYNCIINVLSLNGRSIHFEIRTHRFNTIKVNNNHCCTVQYKHAYKLNESSRFRSVSTERIKLRRPSTKGRFLALVYRIRRAKGKYHLTSSLTPLKTRWILSLVFIRFPNAFTYVVVG